MWKGSLGISNGTQWLQGMLSPIFAKSSVLNEIAFLCSTVASMSSIGNATLDLYGELLRECLCKSGPVDFA